MKRAISGPIVFLLIAGGFIIGLSDSRDSSGFRNRCDDLAYIPDGVFTKQMDSPATLKEYYSSMQEWPFSCLERNTEAYRFLYIPSFDSPASIRVWRKGNHSFVEVKQLTQTGIPKYGAKDLKVSESRPLSDEQWNHFKDLLAKTSFWSMRVEDDTPVGLDGAMFVLEGHERNNYHVIARRSDKDDSLMNLTGYFFDLARLQWNR